MLSFLAWYLLVSLLGLLTFPLAYRLFPKLADRGYTLARTFGLLVWGYLFWILVSLGVIRNTSAGLVLALALLTGLSAWTLFGSVRGSETADRATSGVRVWSSLIAWLKANLRLVVVTEVFFLLAFAAWAFVRACNPEIVGTEKPMELAFINAILRSPTFPPRDPWLSGYAISYYYFGYVITAMLAKLTGTLGSVAFNLMLALVFALAAIGAYGLLYNLLALWESRHPSSASKGTQVPSHPSLGFPLLGPLFLLIVSNIEGFLDVLHHRGLFWKFAADGSATSGFWNWLEMKELSMPPTQLGGLWTRLSYWWQLEGWNGVNRWFSEQFVPDRYLWWWRASRVVQDINLAGSPTGEVIDEFPFFSFLLGDLHPHVLAIPFDLLVIALALNLFLGGWKGLVDEWKLKINQRTWAWLGFGLGVAGVVSLGKFIARVAVQIQERSLGIPLQAESALGAIVSLLVTLLLAWVAWLVLNDGARLPDHGLEVFLRGDLGEQTLTLPLYIRREGLLVAALVFGGLAFMNVWDLVFVMALLCGGYALGRVREAGWSWSRLGELIAFGLPVGALAVVLYLPWFASFTSQAGGILPNLVTPTRGAHLWVMFASLLLPLFAYLVYLRFGEKEPARWLNGFGLAAGIALLLWALSWALGWLVSIAQPDLARNFLQENGASGFGDLFWKALLFRLSDNNGGWITLLLLLGLSLAYFVKIGGSASPAKKGPPSVVSGSSSVFILFLIIVGSLVVLGPEYLYLRDQFGGRMNTVFKFYYQAWIVWALAAAFGAAVLMQSLRKAWNTAFRIGLIVLLFVALTYPALSLLTKTNNFQPFFGRSLDGAAHLEYGSPFDADAIRWMQTAPDGIVAEAAVAGGSYTDYSRYSTYTGLPTVLGWPGHEGQWRGGYELQGTRLDDVRRLYATSSWEEARQIIDQYHIHYIVVGPLERQTYHVDENKFGNFLYLAYRNDEVRIYLVP